MIDVLPGTGGCRTQRSDGGWRGQSAHGRCMCRHVRLNDEDVVVVCTIIATAEYCNEVVGALGRNVAKTLDPPFGSQVVLPRSNPP